MQVRPEWFHDRSGSIFAADRRRWRLGAVLIAASLGVAACGSTETSSAPTLATTAPTAPTTADALSTPPTSAAPSSTAATPSDPTTSATEPSVNLFPDIDVLDIADGSTVNLASELGGGATATLLWFFAPH